MCEWNTKIGAKVIYNNWNNLIIKMDKFEVSLADILGIEDEYNMFNKQAKVCLTIHITIVLE